MNPIQWAERGLIPDPMIRFGIRRLLKTRLAQEGMHNQRRRQQRRDEVLALLRASPVAVAADVANRQHYEVPSDFFVRVLGPRLKYSACLWKEGVSDLAGAEEAMLSLYAQRANLANGQNILELGCGWGSLTLWMAEHFPDSRITAVSNSSSQRHYIETQARMRDLNNARVMTADVNDFSTDQRFDRVVTVEMLEHVRNYPNLFERISQWLENDGAMFAHIFCHRDLVYPFEAAGNNDWMAEHFFTGGMMPSFDTFNEFQTHMQVLKSWSVPGWHYRRTADAWLQNMDGQQEPILRLFRCVYGQAQEQVWWQRWRMFFMACSELFGYDHGREWMVGHYLWRRRL